MLVYGKCECFVMQMVYVCVLCVSCGTYLCCVLHVMQFVNAGVVVVCHDQVRRPVSQDSCR